MQDNAKFTDTKWHPISKTVKLIATKISGITVPISKIIRFASSYHYVLSDLFELQQDKTNKMTCAPSKDYISLGIFMPIVKSDQTGRGWCLPWVDMSFCWFCRAAAHFRTFRKLLVFFQFQIFWTSKNILNYKNNIAFDLHFSSL